MSIKSFFPSNKSFSFENSIIVLFTIFLLRVFLEMFSNPISDGLFFTNEYVFLHVPIFYFSTFLSLVLVLYMLTRDTFENIFPFLIKAHLLILIAPIIDFVVSGSSVNSIGYVLLGKEDLLKYFFQLMLPTGTHGVTIGIHIASYSLFALVGIFIYNKTKKILNALLGIIISYSLFFINAILPSIVILPKTLSEKTVLFSNQLYDLTLQHSWIAETSVFVNNQVQQIDYTHNIFIAKLFWLLLIIQAAIVLFIFNKEKWLVLKNTLRPARTFNYILLACIGIAIGGKINNGFDIYNIINFISLITFILLIILNAILAVFINDAEDIRIDAISNPDRPLARNIISVSDWKRMRNIIIVLIIFGTLTLSKLSAFFLILTQGIYYIYSAYPFRFKRHYLTSSILMGLATIFVALSGFYLVYPSQSIFSFPIEALIIIGLSQALLSNMKDIKDFAGDSYENIQTLPVAFGIKKAKIIIAFLYAIVFVAIPLILQLYLMLPLALFCGIFAFFLFTKTRYQEQYISLLLFSYMIVLFIFLI